MREQLGHADDGVHRRANFVTHVGQKIAFGTIGSIRRIASLAKVILVLLQFGDIARDPEGTDHLAVVVDEWHLGRQTPGVLSIAPSLFFDSVDQRLAAFP